ncbi:hypothetical protein LMJ53_16700 [Rheinheimera sp. UJ51]|nr:hypothetical protein [Rheinheimera sp. UJ51]
MKTVAPKTKSSAIKWIERDLIYQLILIRISVWLMKLMASLRTCERVLLIIYGKTEQLRATNKFVRALPINMNAQLMC